MRYRPNNGLIGNTGSIGSGGSVVVILKYLQPYTGGTGTVIFTLG
jgi:hypothetical protein